VTTAAIETEGLCKRYGATVAVSGLSLTVANGEVFGFLGPNGAGKTTAVKMLLALVPPSAGWGRVLGAPLGDRAIRARIGFLPEHFHFHDALTAREFLRFHGRLFGLCGVNLERRLDALIARVDLLDAADRPLRSYSKGMLQRAGLAQALINDPALVFLDEPTSGLDPLGRLLVRDMIRELRARGTTVFLNSHLLGEVEATCDRVAFVKQGRIVHQLSLAAAPEALDVEIRVAPPLEPDVLEGLGCVASSVARAGEDRLRMRVRSDAEVAAAVRWLVERGVAVFMVQAHRKSLEEWFVDVMGDDQRPG
jgi:ABC-2 type transport system ATP-binding protein